MAEIAAQQQRVKIELNTGGDEAGRRMRGGVGISMGCLLVDWASCVEMRPFVHPIMYPPIHLPTHSPALPPACPPSTFKSENPGSTQPEV